MTTKRILVVSPDLVLGGTRSLLLQVQGYKVDCADSDEDAMRILESIDFDLVLLGRNSLLFEKRLDQRIREKYPKQLTLKIQPVHDAVSLYASRTVDSLPRHVIDTLKEMLAGS